MGRADRALWILCGGAGLVLLLALSTFGTGRDQGIYAVVADGVLRGGAPYADAWDFKPPAIFLVYAAARGLLGTDAIRALEILALLSLLPAFAALSRRALGDGRAGWLAAAVAILCHVQLEYWDTAQPESFGGVATVWALVCAGAAGEARGRRGLFGLGAGLLYGLAGLCKPHLGAGLLVSAGFAFAADRRRGASPGAAWLRLVPWAAGAALGLGSVAVWLAAHGALDDAVEVFGVFVPSYQALRFSAGALALDLLRALRDGLLAFSWLLPAGLLLLASLPARSAGERPWTAHVAAVAGLQIAGIALQARFYPYHFGATLLLLALPAAWGLWKGWLGVRERPAAAAGALLALVLLAAPAPSVISYGPLGFWERVGLRLRLRFDPADARLANRLHSTGDVHFAANRRAAAWLREHSAASESIFIWGFEPMVYDLAGRRPASRYLYTAPLLLEWPGRERARRALLEDLDRDPPRAVAVVSGDARPGVTGSARDSAQALADFAELSRWLSRGYVRAARIEDFTLYRRRPADREARP